MSKQILAMDNLTSLRPGSRGSGFIARLSKIAAAVADWAQGPATLDSKPAQGALTYLLADSCGCGGITGDLWDLLIAEEAFKNEPAKSEEERYV